MGYVGEWLHTPSVDLTVPRDFYEGLPEKTRKLLRCTAVGQLPEEKSETYLNVKF